MPSRWILQFCGSKLDVQTVSLALNIYARLVLICDGYKTKKFKECLTVLSHSLRPYWYVTQLLPPLLSLLCGLEMGMIDQASQYNVSFLMSGLKSALGKLKRSVNKEALKLIMTLVKETVLKLRNIRTPLNDIWTGK